LSDSGSDGASLRLMALLLVVAMISVFTLWTLSSTVVTSQSVFGIYLAVDLVCFAMISYIYRTSKSGGRLSRAFMVAGCVLLLILVGAGFAA